MRTASYWHLHHCKILVVGCVIRPRVTLAGLYTKVKGAGCDSFRSAARNGVKVGEGCLNIATPDLNVWYELDQLCLTDHLTLGVFAGIGFT